MSIKSKMIMISLMGVWVGWVQAQEGAFSEERETLVRAQQPQQKDAALFASYPAEILPFREAVIAAEIAGPLVDVPVDVFQDVAEGALLAQVDTDLLALQVQQAQAQFDLAERQLSRAEGLIEKKAITENAYLERSTRFAVAKADLELLQTELEKASVRAPWSGSIAEKQVEVGDYVVPGQPLFALVDDHKLRVRATVPAQDAPLMHAGLAATVHFQHVTVEIKGSLGRISPVLDAQTRTLDVEMILDREHGDVRPGMVAELHVRKETLHDVLCIPLQAVVEFETEKGVYVIEQGVAKKRIVTLGPVMDQEVVISSGLSVTDQVIVEGQQWVAEGQKVRQTEENE